MIFIFGQIFNNFALADLMNQAILCYTKGTFYYTFISIYHISIFSVGDETHFRTYGSIWLTENYGRSSEHYPQPRKFDRSEMCW